MEPLEQIAQISAVAIAAGINPWLAALTLVGLSAFGLIETGALPLIDSGLAEPAILLALVMAFLIEQVADKIPGVDHVSDLVHLPIKPAAAIGLVAVILAPQDPSRLGDYIVPLAAAAGLLAVITHLGKASLRSGSTLATAGIGNPFLSVLEDLGAIGLIVLAVAVPLIALLAVAGAIFLSGWGGLRLLRRRGA